MFDSFHGGGQFVRMDFRVSAELASVAIKELPNRYAQGIIERKNPVIE